MPKQKIFSTDGGSVQANDGLYIARAADEELLELCRAGAFTYVLTPRQMGKSSLMVRTAERLSDEGFSPFIIDLQAIGVELTAEQWYYGLVSEIDEKTSLRTNVKQWWKEHEDLGFGQRLMLFFKDVLLAEAAPDERIVIFVDEIDTTLSLKFSDDFFTAVRSIYGSRASEPQFRRLSFVLIGVATPTDLISDPKRTPFNIGQRVDLTDFTFKEAQPLAQGLGLPEAESHDVLRWAMRWTGGHPFLTQQLCAAIAAKGKAGWTEEDVNAVVAEKFLGEDFGKNSNLLFVRDMLTKRAPDRESVLNTYNEVLRGERPVPDEGQSVSKAHLKLSGVVCAEDGSLRVRNLIYREVFNERWVKKHNPPNWTKRLVRVAAALVAAVLFLMLPVGVFALYQWRQADAEREVAQQALAEAITQRNRAEVALKEAAVQRDLAEAARVEAQKFADEAQKSADEAQESASLEKKSKTEAEAQRNKALAAAAEAERQRQNAEREKGIADQLRRKAEQQKQVVEQQKKVAEQSQLVSQSLSAQRAGNYQHAVLLAREALRRERFDAFSIDAYQALSQGLSMLPRPLQKYEGLYSEVALSDDGEHLLSALRSNSSAWNTGASSSLMGRLNAVVVYDDQRRETAVETFKTLSAVVFSPDKKYLLTSDVPLSGSIYDNVNRPINSNLLFNSNANLTAGDNTSLNANTPANRNAAPNVNRFSNRNNMDDPYKGAFAAKVWQWNGRSLTEVAGGLALGRQVEAVALGPGGKLIAVARRRPTAQARRRGTPTYRPAGLFFGGARQTQGPPQEGEPVIEMRKVDEPAARPEILAAPLRLSGSTVAGLVFSQDGRRLAMAQEDGTWVVWASDGESGYRLLTYGRQDNALTVLALSPDGKRLATAGQDNNVRVWLLPGALGDDASQAEFRNSAFAAVVFAGMYADFEEKPVTERPFNIVRGHGSNVNSIAFAPDAEYLATASDDGTARLWWVTDYAESAEVARMVHEGSVQSVGFGAGGTRLVTASADGTARVWEVPGAGGSLGEVVFGGASVTVTSSNRRFVLLNGPEEFRVWDLNEGKFTYKVDAKSTLGQYLTAAGAEKDAMYLSDDGRHLLAYTPDEKGTPQSAQSSTGWWVRFLDLAEKGELWHREGEMPNFVWNVFSPNGKYLALAEAQGAEFPTLVLDLRDGREVLSLDAQESEYFEFKCFTSDGDHMVLSHLDDEEKETTVRVLEVKGGRKVGEWRTQRKVEFTFTSSGGVGVKGGYVAWPDEKNVVWVWEAISGRVVNRMNLSGREVYGVMFSPDSEHFAVRGLSEVSMWKLGESERPLATITMGARLGLESGSQISYNSTGEFISVPTFDGTVVWNALTGCEVARVESSGASFVNAGGTRVLTVDVERGGAVWRKVGLNDLLTEVCDHVTRNLTLSEWHNDYRLSADAPPLRCENIKEDKKGEAADVLEQGNVCNLSAGR